MYGQYVLDIGYTVFTKDKLSINVYEQEKCENRRNEARGLQVHDACQNTFFPEVVYSLRPEQNNNLVRDWLRP